MLEQWHKVPQKNWTAALFKSLTVESRGENANYWLLGIAFYNYTRDHKPGTVKHSMVFFKEDVSRLVW